MSDVRLRDGGPYSLYCYDCGRWIPNTANAEMQKEGAYAHGHYCFVASGELKIVGEKGIKEEGCQGMDNLTINWREEVKKLFAYLWRVKKEKQFTSINPTDVVNNMCEDGYEDMSENFDYKDKDFIKAQELLNAWLKHDSVLDMYEEDCKVAVLLDDVIEAAKRARQNIEKRYSK